MDKEQAYDSRTISILLVSASLVLLANGVYTVQFFSVQYGVGAGAVLQGQVIGYSGNTGFTEKPHLHLQVHIVMQDEKGLLTLRADFENLGPVYMHKGLKPLIRQ